MTLSAAGRRFAAKLTSEQESRVSIDELRDGLRVSARSWVGIVRLDSVEIRIVPKLAGEYVGFVRLLEFLSATDELWRVSEESTLQVAGHNLFDLMCMLYARACEGVLRRGLFADYIEREDVLGTVRGRLLVDRQVRTRFGQIDQLHCRFDELDYDVDENRLLGAALRAVLTHVQDRSVHRRIVRLRAVFEPLADPTQLDLRQARRMTYNRLTAHYEKAHRLAHFLLAGIGVDDLFRTGVERSFAFLVDMNALFERFVSKVVRTILPSPGYRVHEQFVESSVVWDAQARCRYRRVIPDLLVETDRARLPMDAKYKLYDERRIDPGDIYQAFLYAHALGASPDAAPPTTLLLYPSSRDVRSWIDLRVRSFEGRDGASVLGFGLPIPTVLDELARRAEGPVCNALRRHLAKLTGCDAISDQAAVPPRVS